MKKISAGCNFRYAIPAHLEACTGISYFTETTVSVAVSLMVPYDEAPRNTMCCMNRRIASNPPKPRTANDSSHGDTGHTNPKTSRTLQLSYDYDGVLVLRSGVAKVLLSLTKVRRPWGACWMVAEGGEGENPSFPKPWGPGPQAAWRPGPQASGAWIPPLSPASLLP